MKLAILITCFNRKNTTLNCIQKIFESNSQEFTIDIFVVDGGSSDGTVSALIEKYPSINIDVCNGLYWNRGMIAAWENACSTGIAYDGFLLLNDDVSLHKDALNELVQIMTKWEGTKLSVGYTVSPSTSNVSYGGLKRKTRFSRLGFEVTKDNHDEILTMNGNCVLVPRTVFTKIGMLNPRFQHSFGDIDYGLRVTKAGLGIELTKNPVAQLEASDALYSSSRKMSLKEVFSLINNPKGLPIKEWFFFTRTHAGPLWLINFGLRYFKMLIRR